ncbi:aspartate/glutamate racemase family protein [Sporohalobacter salinus]|uniref:aspartate/glutamate racemase family protein n=1 Tax=Sporohalobacter salinus TaxID=1494606 RepID=UPI0019619DE3|nr:aspartate/glutamate racemase family protein [Sporohalobacter salinus]MBM7624096.1 glutamate racemase [Sporohalobacter salinus]
MGINYFKAKGLHAVGSKISKVPEETSTLQVLNPKRLKKIMLLKINWLTNKFKDINTICIYCNSLSTAVNLEELRREIDLPIITPLEAYHKMGKKYNKIGVLAANCQATAGIENIIQSVNSSAQVIGIGALPLVSAIEEQKTAKDIINKLKVNKIVDFFTAVGVEVIILGCTHFPYIEEELESISKIPIFNPSDQMLKDIHKNRYY